MFAFIFVVALLQAEGAPIESIGRLGGVASASVAGAMLYFWRQDRRDRAEEKRADVERLTNLAKDFRTIVQDNTAAMTRLTDRLDTMVGAAPRRG